MKRFFIFLLLLSFSLSIQAQNKKLDSINNLISKASTDTGRIKLLMEKIKVLERINLDSAISIGNIALQEAQKVKYYHGELKIRKRLSANYARKGDFAKAKQQLDHLAKLIRFSKDSSDFEKLYDGFGYLYALQTKYDSARMFFEKAIYILEATTDSNLLALEYMNVATSFEMNGNYHRAIAYFQKTLRIAEAQKDIHRLAYTYLNMAIAYIDINDHSKGDEYYLKAIKAAKKKNLTSVIIYAYANLSSSYLDQQKWQQGYNYGMKAASLGQSLGDQGIQASSLAHAAKALFKMNKVSQSEALTHRAILVADLSRQSINILATNSLMGDILRQQKKYKAATPFYEKCLLYIDTANLYNNFNIGVYSGLATCYAEAGKYKKALHLYSTAMKISDSVKSKSNIRKTTELTMNYEFEKKQQKLKAEQLAREKVAAIKQKALIAGLILVAILALVVFRGYRNKQHANKLLNKKNEEIDHTLTELKSTQKQLVQSAKLASLGELTAGIAHEIQNPLNFVNNFSEVNTEILQELKAERLKPKTERDEQTEDEIINDVITNEEKINHHGKRAGAIVKGMLEHSRVSSGQKEPININALACEYLRLSYHNFKAKDETFNAITKTDFDETIGKINIVPQDIGRVLLNLINNAFYAVNEKQKTVYATSLRVTQHTTDNSQHTTDNDYLPAIEISTKRYNNEIFIKVKDNGNGIPQKVLGKIFQPFFTTKPTGEGTGLGLSLSYDIIKAQGGEIKVDTKEGEGTEFIVKLPVT